MNTNTNNPDSRLDTVGQLRGLLRERFPEAHRALPPSPPPPETKATPVSPEHGEITTTAVAPSPPNLHTPEAPLGVALLDELDAGRGLPPGACVEIVGRRPGSGGGNLVTALVQAAAVGENPRPLALIDGADSFDPTLMSDAPGASGALCRHLLWVRCRHRIDHAFKVADLLLRDGNLPLVLLDLQLCRPLEVRRGIPGGNSAWYRLRSLAESTGVVFLAFTTEPIVPAVPWRLELDHTWPIEAVDRVPATGDRCREPVRHRVVRGRRHGAGESEEEKHASFAAAS